MDNPDSIFCYLKLEKAVFDVAKSVKKKSTKKEKVLLESIQCGRHILPGQPS